MRMRFKTLVVALAIALNILPPAVAIDLIVNGSFESNGGVGQITAGVSYLTGWSSGTNTTPSTDTFNFVMDGNADSTGFPTQFSASVGLNAMIWGPGIGVNNGFATSPDGGYFMGGDGGYATGTFYQQVNGLTVGSQYDLSFWWGGAQLTDSVGDYWTGWDITFGSESDSVGGPGNAIASRGFGPWVFYTKTFTASSSSQTLSFLATGPSGLPPITLLDGVKLSPVSVPEPSTLAMGGFATLLVGLMARRRRCRLARA